MIEDMSQTEIEELFNNDIFTEELKLQCDCFYEQMEVEHLMPVRNILNKDPYEVVTHLISLCGDPTNDSRFEKEHHRKLEVEAMIKALSQNKELKSYGDAQARLDIAMDIIAEMDGILYDIKEFFINFEDEEISIPKACVDFTLDVDLSKRAKIQGAMLPMIEKPRDWKTYRNGGYLTRDTSVALNKGEAEQPQNVLDVLNTLQSNSFKIASWTNAKDQEGYLMDKFKKKYSEHFSREITRNIIGCVDEIYSDFKDREFYFEWRYDFRGRLYSTGYDIHLQSDKYHKGIIVPQNKGK